MQYVKSHGTIVFDPIPIRGNVNKLFKPYWAIIIVNDDVDDYYRWFLKKRFNLILSAPAWGPHITIADGQKADNWQEMKMNYDNMLVGFEHSIFSRSNSEHWWLKVNCPIADEFRGKLKVKKNLHYSYHLTLGTPIPRHIEHSRYIHHIETKTLENS